MSHKSTGFTLVEILLALSLIMLLLGLTFPVVLNVIQRADLDSAYENLYQALIRAQTLSRGQINNSSWGVYLDEANSQYVIFAGQNYASRLTALDEKIQISEEINFLGSSSTEIIFNQISGNPINPSPVTLNIQLNGLDKDITINSIGLISK